MKIYYKDEDELAQAYCNSHNCCECDGTNPDGEPNGYGCDGQEKFIEDNFHLVITETNDKIRKLISVDDLKEIHQLACLESWCKSRGKGKEYCTNCKTIIKLGGHI